MAYSAPYFDGDRPEFRKDLASQRLYFRAKEGRPSATPSVGIVDSGGATIQAAATTYVTQDTVNTTINATSAVGDKSLTVSSGTGIEVGGVYRIVNSGGQVEWIRPIKVVSTTVTLGEPLAYAYASTNAFQSCDFYYTLQSGDVDALGEFFVATATYTVSGVANVQPITQTFDVVLHTLNNILSVDAIRRRWPDLLRTQPEEQEGEAFSLQREEAWVSVKNDLRALGRRPALITSSENLYEMAMARLAMLLFDAEIPVIRGNVDKLSAMQELERRYQFYKRQAVEKLEYYDEAEDAARGTQDANKRRLDMVR